MNRLIRWYNQNRVFVWIATIMIVLILVIIQILNALVGEENAQKRNNLNSGNSSTNDSTTISKPNTSVITGDDIPEESSKTNEASIKQFVEYCNNGEIENAYNMLTDECKSNIYPSLEYFNENYYQKVFYMQRMYKLENWYAESKLYTYYITYTEDVLATGNLNSVDNKSDYITVVRNKNENKLNISSYVGREMLGKTVSRDGVNITINFLDLYMDYTIANISMKNNTNSTICVDTKDNIQKTYLYGENDVKYTALLNETANEQLTVKKGMTNKLNIKFNKIYNTEREIRGIIFSGIVLNYEEYLENTSSKKGTIINIEI